MVMMPPVMVVAGPPSDQFQPAQWTALDKPDAIPDNQAEQEGQSHHPAHSQNEDNPPPHRP
jgi:hypothetical protein